MAKMTPEERALQEQEFAQAFNSETPAKAALTEDEEFAYREPGAETPPTVEPAVEEAASQGAEPAAAEQPAADQVADAESGGDGEPSGEPASVTVEIEPNAADGTDVEGGDGDGDEPVDPKDVQRAKSWEGRLRKREEELAAREAAIKAREDSAGVDVAVASDKQADEAVTSKIDGQEAAAAEVAEAVASGEMTAEQAMKTLDEDFGPEFTKMLGVLIKAHAGEVAGKLVDERAGGLSKTIDSLIGEIVADKQTEHFGAISDAHPDFEEVGESQGFKDYIEAMPEDERAKALEVIDNGSARQIIKLIGAYKASMADAAAEPEAEDSGVTVDEDAAGAAEGVRSTGVRLPEQPTQASGYEEAWEKF